MVALLAAATPSAALAATAGGFLTGQVKLVAVRPALHRERIAPSALGPAVSFAKPASAPSVSHSDSVRPAATCPANGDWVGFIDGNVDINLEYESSGGVQVGSCLADDETLNIPYKNSSGTTVDTLTIPAGTAATANAAVNVNTSGTLLIACTETATTWNQCTANQPVGSLDDESGDDITVSSGLFEAAPATTLNMNDNAIVVKSTGTFDSTSANLDGPQSGPNPGAWEGIVFGSGTTGSIQSTTINSAGGGFSQSQGCSACYAEVAIDSGSTVSITGSTLKNSQYNGIQVEAGASPTITSDAFVYQTDQGFNDNTAEAVEYENLPGDLSGKISGLTSSGYGVNVVQFGDGQSTLSYSASSGTWPNAGIPYSLSTNVDIVGGAHLTIPSGTTVGLNNDSIFVQNEGNLAVSGSSGSSVTFTSTNQIQIGGSPAQPGDWGGVDYQEGSAGSVTHAVFDFGGAGLQGSTGTIYAELAIEGPASSIAVSNSQFNNSYSNGVELADKASMSLSSDSFTYCTDCSYNNNGGYPVQFDYVPGNLTTGISPNITPLLSGLTSTGYGNNFISVASAPEAGDAIWPNAGLEYWLQGAIDIQSGGTLAPGPGVTLLTDDSITAESGGTLDLVGKPGMPVTVTSYNDYLNSGTTPQPGDWDGITYQTGSSGLISYAAIRYGGAEGAELTDNGTTGNLTVTDSSIIKAETNEVNVTGTATPVFQRDTFGLVASPATSRSTIRTRVHRR